MLASKVIALERKKELNSSACNHIFFVFIRMKREGLHEEKITEET